MHRKQEHCVKLTKAYNWLIFQVVNPQLEEALKDYATGDLIDIGCGEKPYESMAKPYVRTHIGFDHPATYHRHASINLFGTAYKIGVRDEIFDTVLCTYTLEHLEEPFISILEAYRLLKPGGYAIYVVPLYWHLHEEPRDFYRYTKYGLSYLFNKSGFEIVEIIPLSGFWVTFAQELVYYLWRYRKGGKLNPLWWIVPPLGFVIQGFAYLLNIIDRSDRFTCEYLVVARRPKQGLTLK